VRITTEARANQQGPLLLTVLVWLVVVLSADRAS